MKKAIDALIPEAYDVLEKVGIVIDGSVDNAWRGQISSFGSAVKNGSLIAAVAFFSDTGNSAVKRERLMMAIWLLLHEGEQFEISLDPKTNDEKKAYKDAATKLFNDIRQRQDERKLKQDVINAAVALKLAMNLYNLDKDKKDLNPSAKGVQET